jgi:hypothetical protein
VIVVLAGLALAGGSSSSVVSVVALAVSIIGLIPTSLFAYYDYRAHQAAGHERR